MLLSMPGNSLVHFEDVGATGWFDVGMDVLNKQYCLVAALTGRQEDRCSLEQERECGHISSQS